MADGLNKSFLNGPLAFLRRHLLSVVDGNMQTGINKVGFYADGERVLLKQFLGPVGKYQHPFDVYFLRALPDAENPGLGFAQSTARFFFTSTLSGCQFLAFGDSRDSLTVQHNNNLSGGSYEDQFRRVPRSAISSRVHNGGLYDIDADDIGNVVGLRDPGGWHFYFQKIERERGAEKRESGPILVSKKTITVSQLF